PPATTAYWDEAANSCGASGRRATSLSTVTQGPAAAVAVQPSGGPAVLGHSITVAAAVIGTSPRAFQWYEGIPADVSHPVAKANIANATIGPILAPTSFWLLASNDCGEVKTIPAPVTIASNCVTPAITTQPSDQL